MKEYTIQSIVRVYKWDELAREDQALLQAAKDFNIDLSESWMVGDSENDVKCGRNAGCRTALIGTEDFGQTETVESLRQFTELYLNKMERK